jgi:hypothetical protein
VTTDVLAKKGVPNNFDGDRPDGALIASMSGLEADIGENPMDSD